VTAEKVNARIAGGRSVRTRKVVSQQIATAQAEFTRATKTHTTASEYQLPRMSTTD
jgi:methylaspartate ammonia-lyase